MIAKEIINWIHNYKAVFPTFFRYLPALFSLLSLALIIALGFQLIPEIIILLWLFIGLGISGFYVKKINELARNTGNAKDTFKQYHKLLNEIENTTFTSDILKNKQLEIAIILIAYHRRHPPPLMQPHQTQRKRPL